MRALAASAYRHGARFVDVAWFDPHVKRARIEQRRSRDARLRPGLVRRAAAGARREPRGARRPLRPDGARACSPTSTPCSSAATGSRPSRRGSRSSTSGRRTGRSRPCPTQTWADLVFPDLEPAERLPAARAGAAPRPAPRRGRPAWRSGAPARTRSCTRPRRSAERRFDALHYEGPGTDLTIGLLPTSGWHAARFETVDGLEHMPNLPTEEVFTTPDPERTQGVVASTKPLVLIDGTVVRDLVVRFEGGRAVDVQASTGGDTLNTILQTDDGRRPPGRVRARRPRGPDRRARHDLLRHAARRERGEPHRARPGLPVRARRGRPRRAATRARSTSTS